MKLHRCKNVWVKVGGHPCWRVQKALDEAGISYELVPHPTSRSKRKELRGRLNQALLPVIELEDGTVYRAESKEMAKRIPMLERTGEAEPLRSNFIAGIKHMPVKYPPGPRVCPVAGS